MKSYGSRLLTLLLAITLVFSVVLPAFAIDIRNAPRPPKSEAAQKDVDENPFPNVAEKPRFFLLRASLNRFLFVPVWIGTSTSAAKPASEKSNLSSVSGYAE